MWVDLNRIHQRTKHIAVSRSRALIHLYGESCNTGRIFTARDCINKRHGMFPLTSDINNTILYFRPLKNHWSGLYFHPEKESGENLIGVPKILDLHIVCPWSQKLMHTLSPLIVCDVTFNITVYKYHVVMISTSDGNNQHRPLMCSYSSWENSTGPQWRTILPYSANIFKLRWVIRLKEGVSGEWWLRMCETSLCVV